MLDKETIDRINSLKILEVADKLNIEYTSRGSWRFTSCFLHEERTPSLGISPSRNRWKCFGCSELLTDRNFIWLATGGKNYLTIQALQPLRGRKIIIFPDTNPTGATYHDWLRIAHETARQFGHPSPSATSSSFTPPKSRSDRRLTSPILLLKFRR